MKTFLKIPFEPAPEDPSWMFKARSGKKMSPPEAEEYFKWKHDKEHYRLISDNTCHGVPSNG